MSDLPISLMLREGVISKSLFRQWEKHHHNDMKKAILEYLKQSGSVEFFQIFAIFLFFMLFPGTLLITFIAWAEVSGTAFGWLSLIMAIIFFVVGCICVSRIDKCAKRKAEQFEIFKLFHSTLEEASKAFDMPYEELHTLIPNGKKLLVADAGKILRLQAKEERFEADIASKERVDLEEGFRAKFDALKAFGIVSNGYGPIFAEAKK